MSLTLHDDPAVETEACGELFQHAHETSVWATAAWFVVRQKHDDLIGTSARARATSSCCLTIRAGSGFPRRTRHSW